MAAALRAVTPDERPKPRRRTPAPKTITQAASRGTHRELLVAMRDRIAKTVEDPQCPPRELAALSRRLMEIAKDIEAIDLAEKQEGKRGRTKVVDEAFDAASL